MATEPPQTRRERLRAQTLDEIKGHALGQIAKDGLEALSLNGVARSMGMSGPALYRYFASRDELIAALIADAWNGLADAIEQAARDTRRRAPAARFRALCDVYREWALAQPHRYRLALETSYGSGRFAPETTLPAASRSMVVVVDAVMDLGPPRDPRPGAIRALDADIVRWVRERGYREDAPPAAFELALLVLVRLHGTVSLEITGTFGSMGIDPSLLFRAEVDHLLAQHAAFAAG